MHFNNLRVLEQQNHINKTWESRFFSQNNEDLPNISHENWSYSRKCLRKSGRKTQKFQTYISVLNLNRSCISGRLLRKLALWYPSVNRFQLTYKAIMRRQFSFSHWVPRHSFSQPLKGLLWRSSLSLSHSW